MTGSGRLMRDHVNTIKRVAIVALMIGALVTAKWFYLGKDWAAQAGAYVETNLETLTRLSEELWRRKDVSWIRNGRFGGPCKVRTPGGLEVDVGVPVSKTADGNHDIMSDPALVSALDTLKASRILDGSNTSYEQLLKWIVEVRRLNLAYVERSKVGVVFGVTPTVAVAHIVDANMFTVDEVLRDLGSRAKRPLSVPRLNWFAMLVESPGFFF